MSSFVLKSKEKRTQNPPIPTSATSTVLRRTICLEPVKTAAKPSKTLPTLRRSVPTITVTKTPDLLNPPKFSGQQFVNRKPDLTKNLPKKDVQNLPSRHVPEKQKLDP